MQKSSASSEYPLPPVAVRVFLRGDRLPCSEVGILVAETGFVALSQEDPEADSPTTISISHRRMVLTTPEDRKRGRFFEPFTQTASVRFWSPQIADSLPAGIRNTILIRMLEELTEEQARRIREQHADRITRLLMALKKQAGSDLLPITHEKIARYLGTSREVVTLHLCALREAGKIAYSRRRLQINF